MLPKGNIFGVRLSYLKQKFFPANKMNPKNLAKRTKKQLQFRI